MVENDSSLGPKGSKQFCCINCHYSTFKKSQYDRHLLTDKHQKSTNDSKMVLNDSGLGPKGSKIYRCECGNIYKYDSGYYRHKKVCKLENKCDKIDNSISDKYLIIMLMKQNTELMDMLKNNNSNQLTNSLNHSHNNSNNKTFNLQFFLNETCKDAMNIMDFVDSIKLQLSDLEKVGEVGYTQGISDIITTNLKALDVTQRPVHCTDKKRETMYIKDEDAWEKEDENKTTLRKVIKKVANKNSRLLSQFREKNPNYKNAESHVSDKYDKMVVEAMGGKGDNDSEKENKIIHNISKCVVIDKIQ
jgi:hypothetical protein